MWSSGWSASIKRTSSAISMFMPFAAFRWKYGGRNMPHQLSSGQPQRVDLARALVNNPSLILADEPTGALDTRTSVEVMEIFQRLNRERNLTVIVVTHEQDIAQYANRLIQFCDGRIRKDFRVENRKDATEVLSQLPLEIDDEDDELVETV